MNNTKRKKLSGRVTFFLFTLIPVVLYTFFYVVSVINGIRYSFTDWDGMAQKMNFIGWKNYKILLKNPNFWNAIKTTVIYSVLLVIGVIVTSLILSISLNSLKKFKTFSKIRVFCSSNDWWCYNCTDLGSDLLSSDSGNRESTGNFLVI